MMRDFAAKAKRGKNDERGTVNDEGVVIRVE
jgi:hypothetical protein